MKNLKALARNDKFNEETIRTFKDWFLKIGSFENEPRAVFTYFKNRLINQAEINKRDNELEELNRNLNKAIEDWETAFTISSIRKEIYKIEKAIEREGQTIREQPAKCMVNEEDIKLFLKLIDQNFKYNSVYDTLKATWLRLNEMIDSDNIPVITTETGETVKAPSPQWIIIHEDGYDRQPRTREYTGEKREEE